LKRFKESLPRPACNFADEFALRLVQYDIVARQRENGGEIRGKKRILTCL
jgi:hypothetical protein